jgi:hypothetical protein
MHIPWDLSDAQALVGLRAMKAVALANGVFATEERELIDAAARALGLDVNADDLEPATPEAVADAVPDETWRHRVLQAMVAMALVDGEATRDELAVIQRFSQTMNVGDPWVRNLERILDGHLLRLRIDMARRIPAASKAFAETWKEEGLRGLWRLIQVLRKKGVSDPEIAWRYKQLGLLPEGTLGRAYWKHMTERRFAFSGEPGGMLERQNHHDLTHVLTGYDTDPAGECQIAAFYAGYEGQDPFGFVFMVLVMFQLGIKLGPAEPAKMKLDPERVLRAMRRGAQINTDLTDHWDYWPLLDRPIDEVRRKYNIVPA